MSLAVGTTAAAAAILLSQPALHPRCQAPLASVVSPLSALRKIAATDQTAADDAVDIFCKEDGVCVSTSEGKYCKYDAIRVQLAASRARSHAQGRQGCCGKAADYLGATGPPPGSPWARDANADRTRDADEDVRRIA